MLPSQRSWRETVSLLDVMWPRSSQWERVLLGKNSSFAMPLSYRRLHFPYWWRVTTKQIYNQLNFCARSSDFIWRENQCCLCELLAFFSGYGILNVLDSFYINAILVTLFSALEISSQSGVIPARTSQKITATAYPSRRIAYKFKLSYELLSMFGMYALVNPGPFSFSVLCSV